MGLALRQEEVLVESALYAIEAALLPLEEISAQQIMAALKSDLERALPVSPVVFSKYVRGNRILSTFQVHTLLQLLRRAIAEGANLDPEVFLSYAQASVVCIHELQARRDRR